MLPSVGLQPAKPKLVRSGLFQRQYKQPIRGTHNDVASASPVIGPLTVKGSRTSTTTSMTTRTCAEHVEPGECVESIEPVKRVGPILKYRGSKWRLAPWILQHFPSPTSYTTYIEPYFGSGAVFFTKPPSKYEILNDISGEVVNLFRVVRDHGPALAALVQMTPWARAEYEASYTASNAPVTSHCDERLEAARRFLVRCWQAQHLDFTRQTAWPHQGSKAHSSTTALWAKLPDRLLHSIARLKTAEIECRPATELIARNARPEVLLYVDPPYVLTTRGRRRLYVQEMSDGEHAELLDLLDAHSGPVVLSGYPNALYDQRLCLSAHRGRWTRFEANAIAEGGGRRTEVLWVKGKRANHND